MLHKGSKATQARLLWSTLDRRRRNSPRLMQARDGVGWPQLLINQRTELQETITAQTGGKSCQSENAPLAQVKTILKRGKTRLSFRATSHYKNTGSVGWEMP